MDELFFRSQGKRLARRDAAGVSLLKTMFSRNPFADAPADPWSGNGRRNCTT